MGHSVYVWNNPLAYTDPSGYMSIGQIFKMAVAIAISIWLPGSAAIFGNLAGGLFASIASGFVAGVITGGLKGGLIGAFSAGLFFGIGDKFSEIARVSSKETLGFGFHAAKVLAHGMAGGVMSLLQGGKFGHGFASAGFTEAASPAIQNIPGKFTQGLVATIAGGGVSALTGGKFANGAMSSLFSYAFNTAQHESSQSNLKKYQKMQWMQPADMDQFYQDQRAALMVGAQDGHLTLDEAKTWYQYGEGKPITVDQSQLTVKYTLNTDGTLNRAWVTGSDYLVHGQVPLSLKTMRIYDSPYDFEWHKNRTLTDVARNAINVGGRAFNGSGKPYMILYRGGNPNVINVTPKSN